MAQNIGGVSCTFVKGNLPTLSVRAARWTVPGMHGSGIALLGLGDGEFSLTAVYYWTNASVDAWDLALHALQGSVVSVENDRGQTASNVYIERVHTMETSPRKVPGTAVQVRGEIRVDCLLLA